MRNVNPSVTINHNSRQLLIFLSTYGILTLNQPYDIVVIGSGPAGRRAALQAAKAGARAAIVERRPNVGGVCLHVGTLPSKTLREAVLYLRGIKQRHFYGDQYVVKDQIALEDLTYRVEKIVRRDVETSIAQLERNKIAIHYGQARFLDTHNIELTSLNSTDASLLTANHFIVATGTVPNRLPGIPYDQEVIFDSNFLFSSKNKRKTLPHSLIVLGAGVIGTEYAAIFAALGCKVTLIDQHPNLLSFVDSSINTLLRLHIHSNGVALRLQQRFQSVERISEHQGQVTLEDGTRLQAEAILIASVRTPCIEPLNLSPLGVKTDARGCIVVDEHYRSTVPNIYAAGDVIGFPSLASTSAEQGRLAARYILGLPTIPRKELVPLAIYTIPEIAMVGQTEEQLAASHTPYVTGIAHYREITKAIMIGDQQGMLKLLCARDTGQLLGVHIIGDQAAELIHIGQMILRYGGTAGDIIDSVFNYPTLAGAYKVAALAALNTIEGFTN